MRKMAESKRSTTTSSSSSSSKSRKSRSELIRTVVGSYLKQRNYVVNDRYRKSDLILTQSVEQFVMNTAIKNEISKANSFLFSNIFCLNNNPAQVELHFTKLCNFIECQPEQVRLELSELVNPLLCHLYIEMLKGRDWRPAIEFLRNHAPLLGHIEPSSAPVGNSPLIMNQKINGTVEDQQTAGIPVSTVQHAAIVYSPASTVATTNTAGASKLETFKQLISKLSQITRIQDLESDPLTLQFRSCQYEIRLCQAAVVALRRYLGKYGHSLILHILRNWFYFDTSDDKDFADYSPDTVESEQSKKPRLVVANGQELINGDISMELDAVEAPEPEYNFSEHTEEENNKHLLRNGFSHGFLSHKIRQLNRGGFDADGNALENRGRSAELSTVNMDDDDEDDSAEDLPSLEELPAKVEDASFPDGSEQQLADDIGGLFRKITSAERLRKLRECQQRLSHYMAPLCVYQVENVDDRLTSVAIDSDSCHLASGFEDSSIMIWSVNRSTQIGRKPYATVQDRQCSWNVTSCDSRFSEDDEEEEDESDAAASGNDWREETAHHSDSARDGSSLGNLFRVRSQSEINRLNKLLPVYSRRQNKRERWKQFMERRCSENVYTETGGVTLRGHSSAITDLLFSGHGPLLMSVSRDRTMRTWHASDYNCRAVYRGHNHPLWCVAESPTGLYLATGSRDTTARLWSTEREFSLLTFVGHTQDVDAVAFHPNGNYLATGSTDLTVRLWCVATGRLLRVFTDCRQPIQTICFSPDGKYLAAGGEESRVRIFDLSAGSQLTELRDHTSAVTCVTWSSNGHHLVSAGADGIVRIWDAVRMVSSSSTSGGSGASTGSQQNATNSPNAATASSSSNSGISSSNSTNQKSSNSSGSSSSSNNLLLAYATGCRRIYRVRYNHLNVSLGCIGNS
ncbi:uncharacterized protein LOC128737024 [Sabethes cyaneus]|uniref:uncharacterized protein LOC128737024 n=1 Tax=Sabethes cyaneus TaxID=53552 RepID=UPI00237DA03F|nr:uncharacterized protein LOC128737024 [Sabethes cyaneus]